MMIRVEIDNPALEDRLTKIVREQKIQIQDITIQAIEKFVDSFRQDDVLVSHKKELDRRLHKYQYINKDQLMNLEELKSAVEKKV